jgi:hypothetical protein
LNIEVKRIADQAKAIDEAFAVLAGEFRRGDRERRRF